MTYDKPNMKYTDMAKYIDEHISDDPLSDDVAEKIFIYTYQIVFMLAQVGKLFYRQEYYDDFAIWLASDLFKTFTKKREEKDKIRSSLNYIKKVIRLRKCKFEQEFYSQTIVNTNEIFDDNFSLSSKMTNSIESQVMLTFEDCLKDIILTSRSFLSKIPYYSDRAEWTNIYVSCLLTLLSSIVLDKNSKEKIKSRFENPDVVMTSYLKNNEDIVLYHLDDNMKEYIRILVRELKHVIAKDISLTIHSFSPPEDIINNLVLAEVNNLVTHVEGE